MGTKDISNPKIPLKFVRDVGKLVCAAEAVACEIYCQSSRAAP